MVRPRSAPPTTTRWSRVPTVNCAVGWGGRSPERRRKRGIAGARVPGSGARRRGELAALEERVQSQPGGGEGLLTPLLAVDEDERLHHLGAGRVDLLEGGEEAGAAGDHVVDEQAAVVGTERGPLDRPRGAVLLGLLAHQEAAQRHRVGAAQGDHPGGDRVGAEGEAPDRAHLQLAAAVEDEPGGEVQPAPLEGDLLAVEVEVAAPAAAGQEVAEAGGAALEERL